MEIPEHGLSMTLPKAIIFDMDGTLADTEEIHRQAFNNAFAEFSLPWRWSETEYKHLLSISGGRERIAWYLHEHGTAGDKVTDVEALAHSIHQRKSLIYRDMISHDSMSLRPGIARLVDEARAAGVLLAIATSSSIQNVEILLASTMGIDAIKQFAVIETCETVPEKKPSPAVYHAVLNKLHLQARDCVAIEDTCNGNRAALAAGISTIITIHRFTTDDDFTGATLVIDQLGEPLQPFQLVAGGPVDKDFIDLELLGSLSRLPPVENLNGSRESQPALSGT